MLQEKIKEKIKKLLTWVQKYTKTDMIYLAKGGSWLTLNQGVSMTAAFGLSVLYANFLPKETLGAYKYVLSIGGILSVSTLKGIDSAVEKNVAQKKEKGILSHFKIKIKWGLIGSLTGFAIAGYYLWQDNIGLAASFTILAAFVPFYYSSVFYNSILSGKKKFKELANFRIKEIVFSFIVVGLTIYFSNNLNILLFSFLSSWSTSRYYHFYKTLKLIKNGKKDKDIEAEKFGKHLSFLNTLSTITGKIEQVVIWHFLGPEMVAVFFFAKRTAKTIKEPLKKISSMAFPKFSEKDPETLKRTLGGKIFKLVGVVSIIVLLYIIFSPYLYRLFFPKYTEAIFYTQVYSLTRIIAPIPQFLEIALVSQEQTNSLYKIKVSSDIVKIFVILSATWFYGVLGLIIGLIFIKMLKASLSYYYFRKM